MEMTKCASNFNLTSATIAWNTNVSANSVIEYGVSEYYGQTASNATLTTVHSISLTGLLPFNGYHYRVKSITAAGQTVVSEDHTFVASNQTLFSVSYRKLRKDALGNYLVDLIFINQEGVAITQVNFGYIMLGAAIKPISPALPYVISTSIANGESQSFTVVFPASSGSSGRVAILKTGGAADTFNNPGHLLFNGSFWVLLP